MIALLLGYMWLFIHRPFEVWPILGTMRIERVYMIVVILVWFFFYKKTVLANRATVAVMVLFFSIMLSEYLSPFGAGLSKGAEEWLKVFVFTILIITSIRTERELKVLLTGFCVIFFLYMAHSFYEFRYNGRHVYRMGTIRMIGVDETMNDPNTFGASIVYAIPMLIPLWHLKGKTIWLGLCMKLFAVCSFLLSVVCVLKTGSRSSFVAVITVLLFLACFSKYRYRWLTALVVAAPFIWMGMSDNLKDRYLTIIDPSRGPASAQESAEGRLEGFRLGVQIWEKYPIVGVGPGVSPMFQVDNMQTHNFVGQVLAELGIIGMFAYILIAVVIVMNFLEARRYNHLYRIIRPPGDEYLYSVSVATMITLFELQLLGVAGHNAYRYTWIWYPTFQGIAVMLLVAKIRYFADSREKISETGPEKPSLSSRKEFSRA